MATRCSTWCATGPKSHGLALLALASAPLNWLAARLSGQPDLSAALVDGHGAGAHHPPAARHPDVVRQHAVAAAVQQYHPFAVGGVSSSTRSHPCRCCSGFWSPSSGHPPGDALECSHVGAQHRLPGVECAAGSSMCAAFWRLRCVTTDGSQPDAGHARPFQHRCWRAVAMGPEHYHGPITLAGWHAPVAWTSHPRGARSAPAAADNPMCNGFHGSAGFMRMQTNSQGGSPSPTCMGLGPVIRFHFDIGPAHFPAARDGPGGSAMAAPDLSMALPWLWRRLTDPRLAPFPRYGAASATGTTQQGKPAHSWRRQTADAASTYRENGALETEQAAIPEPRSARVRQTLRQNKGC